MSNDENIRKDSLDIPYPAGVNWESLTPRQVNEAYAKLSKGKNPNIEKLNSGAHRERKEGKGKFNLLPFRALQQIALRLEEGSKKYGPKDWNKGIPQSMLLDSTLRHLVQFMKGEKDENHLVASATNILQMVEQQELIKEGKVDKSINDII